MSYWTDRVSLLALLDQTSRLRLRMFAVKLAATGLFAVIFSTALSLPLSRALAFLQGWQSLFAAIAALLQRHRLDARQLTAWDECAVFFGSTELSRFVSATIG
jgi:hypothetical protein